MLRLDLVLWLTLNSKDDSFADRWRNPVTRDAQVFADVGPRGRGKGQRIAVHGRHFTAVVSYHRAVFSFPHDFRTRRALSVAS